MSGGREGEDSGQAVLEGWGAISAIANGIASRERCEIPFHGAHVADETTHNVAGMRRPSHKLLGGNGQARCGVGKCLLEFLSVGCHQVEPESCVVQNFPVACFARLPEGIIQA